MGQIAGFGIGTPATYGVQPANWGISPYSTQGTGMQPWGQQSYVQPISNQLTSGYGGAAHPGPQNLQLLQILPQQLQQLQFLEQQQFVHIQQLLHLVRANNGSSTPVSKL